MADGHFSDLPLFAQRLPVDQTLVPMTIPSQALTKTCTTCGKTKHADTKQFYRTTKGYLAAVCKDCAKNRTHENRLKRLDDARAKDIVYGKWKRAVIKDAVFQAYGGWQCACCGETERLFLSLDHIENNGAEERRKISGKRSAAGYPMYAYLFHNDFPPGYQILCMNCQHGKRMNAGICPHQGRRNDYGGDTSRGKRPEAPSSLRSGDDEIVCSAPKDAAVLRGRIRKSRAV